MNIKEKMFLITLVLFVFIMSSLTFPLKVSKHFRPEKVFYFCPLTYEDFSTNKLLLLCNHFRHYILRRPFSPFRILFSEKKCLLCHFVCFCDRMN